MGYNHFRYARRIDADNIGLYHDDLTQFLTLNKATANRTILSGPPLTTNSLEIRGSVADIYPFVRLSGNSQLYLMGNTQIDYGIANVLAGRMKVTGGGMSMHMKESTTPVAIADWGAIYTKADNELYFQTGAGVEKTITSV